MMVDIKKRVEVVDIFCGIGGLTNGLIRAKLPVSKGYDIDPFFEYGFEENNQGAKFRLEDVRYIDGSKLFSPGTEVKVLVGCAPCQPFSHYTTKYKYNSDNNDKWNLLNQFLRLVEVSKPNIVSMENVPKLQHEKIFTDFVAKLEANGYHVSYSVVNCAEYGIPQKRKRLVLLASDRSKFSINKPNGEKTKTLRDVFTQYNLPKIKAGEVDKNDRLHASASLSDTNIKRIQASVPGGTWRDWDYDLRLECHKKLTGSTFSDIYGRMEYDQPAPTLTTRFHSYGTGRFGHPEQDRAISLREGALIQTFPHDYKFYRKGDFRFEKVAKAIGNAVPPELGKIIGESIRDHIRSV